MFSATCSASSGFNLISLQQSLINTPAKTDVENYQKLFWG